MSERPEPLLLADIVAELEARIVQAGERAGEHAPGTAEFNMAMEAVGALADFRQWLLEQA